jgi:hypothetical protein
VIACLFGAHLHGRLAHFLYDERDGPSPTIVIGHRKRDTLTLLVNPHHNELASLGFVGHSWSVYLKQLGDWRQILFG